MNVVVSHPTGNRNVRQVVESLNKAKILNKFYTTVAIEPSDFWLKLMPKNLRRELLRRSYSIPFEKIYTDPILELARIILPKVGLHRFTTREKGLVSVDSIYRHLDAVLATHIPLLNSRNGVNAIYAYEDGALSSFTAAKKLGLKCIYDLPIAFWETARRLLDEEALRLPRWKPTLGGGIYDSSAKLERKSLELELADVVVGPSKFVIDSLPVWAKEKIIIETPFGTPTIENYIEKKDNSKRPLRVLFAGSMGQRKGLADLFSAIRLLNTSHIELVAMGSLLAPMEFYKDELPCFTYEKGRPHQDVLTLMRSCDVFCLPSLVEGRALVMQEAMSQGLPLIITPNTGGSDLIKEGITGFLVPIRSPEAIANKLTWFLENRSAISEMGISAQKHASGYTWEKYGNNIVNALLENG